MEKKKAEEDRVLQQEMARAAKERQDAEASKSAGGARQLGGRGRGSGAIRGSGGAGQRLGGRGGRVPGLDREISAGAGGGAVSVARHPPLQATIRLSSGVMSMQSFRVEADFGYGLD